MIWGVAIPGLAMSAAEIIAPEGLFVLNNPGVSGNPDLTDGYSLLDVAEKHLHTILKVTKPDQKLLIIGMSMGGMIASILASRLRSQLPPQTRFRFLVTSANSHGLPCITNSMLAEWQQARPGDEASFRKILEPFLSGKFLKTEPERAAEYIRFRAFGKNSQSPKSFHRQVQAVLNFDGREYFANANPAECEFVHGADDKVMHAAHHQALMLLQPLAKHHTHSDLGHMVNMESPCWFTKEGCTT